MMIKQDTPLFIRISNNITYIVLILLFLSALGFGYSISKYFQNQEKMEKYNNCIKIHSEEECKYYFNNIEED